jgi:hypothetical protein
MKILEKDLFWCQKWIFKNLGGFYIETLNIKVVDNNTNYTVEEGNFGRLSNLEEKIKICWTFFLVLY